MWQEMDQQDSESNSARASQAAAVKHEGDGHGAEATQTNVTREEASFEEYIIKGVDLRRG